MTCTVQLYIVQLTGGIINETQHKEHNKAVYGLLLCHIIRATVFLYFMKVTINLIWIPFDNAWLHSSHDVSMVVDSVDTVWEYSPWLRWHYNDYVDIDGKFAGLGIRSFAQSLFALLLKIALLKERPWAIHSCRLPPWSISIVTLKKRVTRANRSLTKSDMRDLLVF